ncbi:MAG: 2-polyprenyl-6-methoxyphenol hydroxylase [Rickettsiaceae bacterium]|jgi:2-octaprenyl-6-methoxyphenol hydroxylase|nr:2-polyprenyl-6-methoxyphenol hydroxylase [Rickettsiaceae bacterium]
MKNNTTKTEVIIIGGGLTGMLMACALAQKQISVALIESEDLQKLNAKESDGRTSAISYGSAKILDHVGIWHELLEHAGPILDIRVTDGESPLFVHYDHKMVGDEPMGHIIENHYIRKALYEKAVQHKNLTILDNTRYTLIDYTPYNATVTLADGKTITSSLVIAADGKNSSVRQSAGIKTTSWAYNQHGVVCTVKHEKSHHGVAIEKFLPTGPFAILPMHGDHNSSLVWTEKSELAPLFMKMNDAEFQEHLELRFGGYLGKLEVIGKRFSYPLSLCLAQQYTSQRLALIGDAAHAIHPIAGQGFNLGIRDIPPLVSAIYEAKNLGLDIGSSGVLSSYAESRKLDNITMIAITDLLTRLFSNNILPIKHARRLGMGIVNRIPVLKKLLIKHAMGDAGYI